MLSELKAIVLAAGLGKRMSSQLPKVLHEVCGRPMIDYVLDATRQAGAEQILLVVGQGGHLVHEALDGQEDIEFVTQPERKGTGHAVQMCRSQIQRHAGPVLVVAGDAPLVRGQSLARLVQTLRTEQAACVFGTAVVEDPTGLGRVIRDEHGEFQAIVEHRDATEEQRKLCEINPSYYVFHGPDLLAVLDELRPANDQEEYYITDCPGLLRARGKKVAALNVIAPEEAYGVNSRRELAHVTALMQRQIQQRWMDKGVTIVDPASTFIDSRATVGPDTVILPFCYIEREVTIEAGSRIGPFAYVRAGARLEPGARVGGFVEVSGS